MWLALAEKDEHMPSTMKAELSSSKSLGLATVGMMRSESFVPAKSALPVPGKASFLSFMSLLCSWQIHVVPCLNNGLHVSI
jgi:hypothetical protein